MLTKSFRKLNQKKMRWKMRGRGNIRGSVEEGSHPITRCRQTKKRQNGTSLSGTRKPREAACASSPGTPR